MSTPDPIVYLSASEGRFRVIQRGMPIHADKATAAEAIAVAKRYSLSLDARAWDGDAAAWVPLADILARGA